MHIRFAGADGWILGLLMLLALAGSTRPAAGQTNNYPSGSAPNNRTSTVPTPMRTLGGDMPSFDPNFSHRQMVSRREDLKRRMGENAQRLLMLVHDLQTDLQSREPTEADGKRLDEIAKLARTVRDEMRQ